jgi:hypothetical protein
MADKTPTNPLGMRSITEVMTKSPKDLWAETMRNATSHDWVFEKAWEKLILMAMTLWSAWSIGHWIWSLF